MKSLRKLILLWMFVWLPVSGVMASAMPFCAQMSSTAAEAVAVTPADAMDAHCNSGGLAKQGESSCAHCELCSIAGAVVPPSAPQMGNALPPALPSESIPADFSSFFPDLLPRPPARTQA
jgi:hypothetical protein